MGIHPDYIVLLRDIHNYVCKLAIASKIKISHVEYEIHAVNLLNVVSHALAALLFIQMQSCQGQLVTWPVAIAICRQAPAVHAK